MPFGFKPDLATELTCLGMLHALAAFGLPRWHNGKPTVALLLANAGVLGLIPGTGWSPGVGNGNPLQYSCLENSIDRSLVSYSPWGHKESDTTEHWLPSLLCLDCGFPFPQWDQFQINFLYSCLPLKVCFWGRRYCSNQRQISLLVLDMNTKQRSSYRPPGACSLGELSPRREVLGAWLCSMMLLFVKSDDNSYITGLLKDLHDSHSWAFLSATSDCVYK